jgi:glucokinase
MPDRAANVPTPTPERPWLVADVGGTNARFGLVDQPDGEPSRVRILAGADHRDLAAAVSAYLALDGHGARPSAACVAVAGPVTGDRFRLTNAAWEFSVDDTRHRLGLEFLHLINDFEALALSLPRLTDDDVRPIGGPVARVPGQPMAVLGPGTGLGVAGLLPVADRWAPVVGEGGHVDLPAVDDREIEVARMLRAEQGVVTAECVLSGGGLVRLYRCLARLHGVAADASTAADISSRREDPLCAETLRMFCALLGAFAGNVALTLGARGGVFLGGGILSRIPDVLESSDFRPRFEAKFRMADYVKAIATLLVVAPTPALLGAAAWLEQAARAGAHRR